MTPPLIRAPSKLLSDLRGEVGITGTRKGGTERQLVALQGFLGRLREEGALYMSHGCCTGIDRQAHAMWFDMTGQFHYWPGDPEQNAWAASRYTRGDLLEPVTPYLVRNHRIVDRARVMLALPGEETEQQRSGTWSTIRYARRFPNDLKLWIILPSGKLAAECLL